MSLLSNRDAHLFELSKTLKEHKAGMNETPDSSLEKENLSNSELSKSKTVYCFVGFPGVGKSSQINKLANITGAKVNHVGKFAKFIGINTKTSVLDQKNLEN